MVKNSCLKKDIASISVGSCINNKYPILAVTDSRGGGDRGD